MELCQTVVHAHLTQSVEQEFVTKRLMSVKLFVTVAMENLKMGATVLETLIVRAITVNQEVVNVSLHAWTKAFLMVHIRLVVDVVTIWSAILSFVIKGQALANQIVILMRMEPSLKMGVIVNKIHNASLIIARPIDVNPIVTLPFPLVP